MSPKISVKKKAVGEPAFCADMLDLPIAGLLDRLVHKVVLSLSPEVHKR
jgi:hypothetical protein